MKYVKFELLRRSGTRHLRKGYLLTHPNHPGREFIIARGLRRDPRTGFTKETDEWLLLDRTTGVGALTRIDRRPTLRAMHTLAKAALSTTSAAAMAERVNTRVVKCLTRLLTKE